MPTSTPSRLGATIVVGLVGAVFGATLSFAPPTLFYKNFELSTDGGDPGSAFNLFTLGAIARAVLAGLVLLIALVTLFFRPTRAFGLGYLAGLVAGPVLFGVLIVARSLAG